MTTVHFPVVPLVDRECSLSSRSLRPASINWAIAMCMVALAGCSPNYRAPSPAPDPPTERGVSVQVAEVKISTLHPTLEMVGTIVAIPERTAVVSPKVGGWVEKLNAVEGQTVHEGDILMELDARSAQVAVQRALALLAEKEATVRRLKRGYLPEEIAAARQDADQRAASVDGLRNELDALKELLDHGELSPVIYETKGKALQAAEAALSSAQERVKLLEAGTRPETIAEAEALRDAAKADVEQAKLDLAWCTITSPIDGVVVQMLARKGQYFDRAVPLATVIDLTQVFARLRVPSRDFSKIQLGTPVDARLSSFPGRTFHGMVSRMSGQADPLTGNVVVFARIENDDHLLRPGLNCHVRVSLPEIPHALAVPVAAVADHSGATVVTLIRDGKAYETQVETGSETHDFIQIVQGLSAGDMVAVSGGYGLPQGCPVRVLAAPAPESQPAETPPRQ